MTATLTTYDRRAKVHIPKMGIWYAKELKWKPVQHFYLNVSPGYYVDLKMSGTEWIARYFGSCAVELDTKGFIPDTFVVTRRFPGLNNVYGDIHPRLSEWLHYGAEDNESSEEHIQRSFLIQEDERDRRKLEEWWSERFGE